MKKEKINQPEIKLVGMSARTNNKNEMDPQKAIIGKLNSQFAKQNQDGTVSNRKAPGTTFSVYTDYESDEHGEYTYFIGEEVTSFKNTPANMEELTIPAATYQKFTTPADKMPEVVINAWKEIWNMTAADFGGQRSYKADFQIHDERSKNPNSAVIDIYIGIK